MLRALTLFPSAARGLPGPPDQEATVRLKAYSLTGQLLAEKTVSVPPLAYYQINDVFGPDGLGLGDGPFQNVEIAEQVTDGAGQVVGVVTLVGNISKNPEVYLLKDPGPPPPPPPPPNSGF